MTNEPFTPDWAVHPGEVLELIMEDDGLTKEQVSKSMGVKMSVVNELLNDEEVQIDSELAQRLEAATGFPAKGWLNLEKQYRHDVIRLTPVRVGLFEDLKGFVQFEDEWAEFFKGGVIHSLIAQGGEDRIRTAHVLRRQKDYVILAEVYEGIMHLEIKIPPDGGTYMVLGPQLMSLVQSVADKQSIKERAVNIPESIIAQQSVYSFSDMRPSS